MMPNPLWLAIDKAMMKAFRADSIVEANAATNELIEWIEKTYQLFDRPKEETE